jgi:hypothetical protein
MNEKAKASGEQARALDPHEWIALVEDVLGRGPNAGGL